MAVKNKKDLITNTKVPEATVCPFLGVLDDKSTYLSFASSFNVCYKIAKHSNPTLEHQGNYCLTERFNTCPVFLNSNVKQIEEIFQNNSRLSRPRKINVAVIWIASVIVLLIVFLSFLGKTKNREVVNLDSQLTNTMVNISLVQTNTKIFETGTEVAQLPSVSISQITDSPMPSNTFTEVKTEIIRTLDIPIGDDYQFIIHRISEGESVQLFADLYNTSPEAIYSINFFLPTPIWINALIIIPVNIYDVEDIPAFEAYMVTEDGVSIEKIAELNASDLDQLLRYNLIQPNEKMNIGDWILIPREKISY